MDARNNNMFNVKPHLYRFLLIVNQVSAEYGNIFFFHDMIILMRLKIRFNKYYIKLSMQNEEGKGAFIVLKEDDKS